MRPRPGSGEDQVREAGGGREPAVLTCPARALGAPGGDGGGPGGVPPASAGPGVGLVRRRLLSRFPFKEEHVLPPEAAHPVPGRAPHPDSTCGPGAAGGLCPAGRRILGTPVELTSARGTREGCRHQRRRGQDEP